MIVVAVGFIKTDKGYYLQKRSSKRRFWPGMMELPGGKIEGSETIEAGLARELREETGINADIDSMEHIVSMRYNYGDKSKPVWLQVSFYHITAYEGEPESWEELDFDFYDINMIIDPAFEMIPLNKAAAYVLYSIL